MSDQPEVTPTTTAAVPWADLHRVYAWLRDVDAVAAADALADVMESFGYYGENE